VLLFAATYRHIPLSSMPSLSAPRKSLHITNYGITPFVLAAGDESKVVPPQTDPQERDLARERVEHRTSVSTLDSFESADSNFVPPQTDPQERDLARERVEHRTSVSTLDSFQSADSTVPLTAHQKL
jgi:hypothetical protein